MIKAPGRVTLWFLVAASLVACAGSDIDWVPVAETEHFLFFGTSANDAAASVLGEVLEANYERITEDLQIDAPERFPVYVFPDIKTFHNATGRPDAPATSIGTVRGTDIWLVSPLNLDGVLTTDEGLTDSVYEFTHAVVNLVNGSTKENNYQIPKWLNEGLVGYEAHQMTEDWRARIRMRVAEGAMPSIATDLVPDKFDEVGGLAFSITVVEYLLDQYGFDKIIAILEEPSELETILGVTIPELDIAWHDYLRRS